MANSLRWPDINKRLSGMESVVRKNLCRNSRNLKEFKLKINLRNIMDVQKTIQNIGTHTLGFYNVMIYKLTEIHNDKN